MYRTTGIMYLKFCKISTIFMIIKQLQGELCASSNCRCVYFQLLHESFLSATRFSCVTSFCTGTEVPPPESGLAGLVSATGVVVYTVEVRKSRSKSACFGIAAVPAIVLG
mgnify:FL=1